MNKWIMLLCAGLLVVAVGCGPKDPAAETGTTTGTEASKPADSTSTPTETTTAPTEEKKADESATAPMGEKKTETAPAPGAEAKPEEGKKSEEKPAGEPATK